MAKNCQQLISEATHRLLAHSDSALLDAEVLLSHTIQQSRSWIMAYQDEPVTEEHIAKFQALVDRREAGEPIAYLTGEREFWSQTLAITPDVLIPRPETEILVETALEFCPDNDDITLADLGTGSGAIAIALASERPKAQITAVDQSSAALKVAIKNAQYNNIKNIDFRHGSWFTPLQGLRFDFIVSNPPYIADKDHHLSQGDVRFEPQSALSSGHDGLQDIYIIIEQAPDFLQTGGYLLLEHGFQQAPHVRELLKRRGFSRICTREDYSGNPRVTYAQYPADKNSGQTKSKIL